MILPPPPIIYRAYRALPSLLSITCRYNHVTEGLYLLPNLFLACDWRRRGNPNDLLDVIVNQMIVAFNTLFILIQTDRRLLFSLELTRTWFRSILYFDLNLVARRANTALVFASPTRKIGSPGRRAMVIAHPCHQSIWRAVSKLLSVMAIIYRQDPMLCTIFSGILVDTFCPSPCYRLIFLVQLILVFSRKRLKKFHVLKQN